MLIACTSSKISTNILIMHKQKRNAKAAATVRLRWRCCSRLRFCLLPSGHSAGQNQVRHTFFALRQSCSFCALRYKCKACRRVLFFKNVASFNKERNCIRLNHFWPVISDLICPSCINGFKENVFSRFYVIEKSI